ncbi:hypothetical protein [uncultured Sphingomonas sp.]|uniref:hypothetical protein n=1 Tax=uncultured Sphingomonas sp. TaxID=158754 RepID=UPI0025E70AFD|nr:hypothetical protein [uncultured Sphingomonas sp.]
MAEGSDVNYWNLVTLLGPIVLLAVIIWAVIRNKKSRVDQRTTEEGTRRVYEEEQRIHERDPGSGL